MNPKLYPLQFRPHFKQYLWGGRQLGEVLGKPIGEGPNYAESWEVVDHGQDQSIVDNGPLQGQSLHQIVLDYGHELLGGEGTQFPLLLKYLDAQQDLSLQVHPNDTYGAQMSPPDLGKTEAWVVMHAARGSLIYAGLKRGFDKAAFARELERGTGHLCVHQFAPKVGDCIFIPAGVVHAIGAGLLIAEIQQASNTTFRLHDWNRVGPDGESRPLHLEQGLEVTDYDRGPIQPQAAEPTALPHVARLVHCDKFTLDRWSIDGEYSFEPDERFHILTVLEGAVTVQHPQLDTPIAKGGTVLLPASRSELQLVAAEGTIMLDMAQP
jgi:mannose-6-phosphate isomerase